jgi:hypothetical protein
MGKRKLTLEEIRAHDFKIDPTARFTTEEALVALPDIEAAKAWVRTFQMLKKKHINTTEKLLTAYRMLWEISESKRTATEAELKVMKARIERLRRKKWM